MGFFSKGFRDQDRVFSSDGLDPGDMMQSEIRWLLGAFCDGQVKGVRALLLAG